MGPAGGAEVAVMVAAFRQRRDYVVARLQQVEGIKLNSPDGAFYVMPGAPLPTLRLGCRWGCAR